MDLKPVSQPVIHSFDNAPQETNEENISYRTLVIVLGMTLGVAILIGFAANKFIQPKNSVKSQLSNQTAKQVVGVADKKTFKDKAEGILQEGGIDGEGSFHLQRPGGTSQNVYLTSTTVDLSKYVGRKVRVWGQTFSAEKAGWLMDVGLAEIL